MSDESTWASGGGGGLGSTASTCGTCGESWTGIHVCAGPGGGARGSTLTKVSVTPSATVTYTDGDTTIDISISSETMKPLHFPNALAVVLDAAVRTSIIEPVVTEVVKP